MKFSQQKKKKKKEKRMTKQKLSHNVSQFHSKLRKYITYQMEDNSILDSFFFLPKDPR